MGSVSRRSFLRIAAGIPALAGTPEFGKRFPLHPLGRVAAKSVDVRKEPDPQSPLQRILLKDMLIQILRKVKADTPAGNPYWLCVQDGFIHSGDIQIVEFHRQNPPPEISRITLAEVSVPIAQSYRTLTPVKEILYRLYYKSIHWVKGAQIGEDGVVWYVLRDPNLRMEYFAEGKNLRLLSPDSYAPLHTDVEPREKRIEIRLGDQTLTAYEEAEVARTMKVSSGMPGKQTATPVGNFNVQIKLAGVHMGDGRITYDPLASEYPGVPWVGYFELARGVALHGAFWHNDFGRPRSHGCINLRPEDALWLYRWTNPPESEARITGTGGFGTRVIIR